MKNILVILILVMVGLVNSNAQTMSWVPSQYVSDEKCEDLSDRLNNIMCYKLKYTPEHSGDLTSYSTGFWMECKGKGSIITSNSSCLMEDKSEELLLCDKEGVILLNCSGNSGNIKVNKGQHIYLHQICFEPPVKRKPINILKDDLIALSSSITLESEMAITEEIEYKSIVLTNPEVFYEHSVCNMHLSGELNSSGKVNLTWEPAKEIAGGIYKLFCKDNNGISTEIFNIGSRLIDNNEKLEKYITNHLLQNYGSYTYYLEYHLTNGNFTRSNEIDISFQDDDFSVAITPNPAMYQTKILVKSPTTISSSKLFDNSGKFIKKMDINNNVNYNLDLNSIPPGVYNIIIENNDNIISKKFIVIE